MSRPIFVRRPENRKLRIRQNNCLKFKIFFLEWTSCHSQMNTFYSTASEKGVFGYFQKALELTMGVYLESERSLWWVVYMGVGMTTLCSSPIGRSLTFNLSGFVFRDSKYHFYVHILFENWLILVFKSKSRSWEWSIFRRVIIFHSKYHLLVYVIRKLKTKTRRPQNVLNGKIHLVFDFIW